MWAAGARRALHNLWPMEGSVGKFLFYFTFANKIYSVAHFAPGRLVTGSKQSIFLGLTVTLGLTWAATTTVANISKCGWSLQLLGNRMANSVDLPGWALHCTANSGKAVCWVLMKCCLAYIAAGYGRWRLDRCVSAADRGTIDNEFVQRRMPCMALWWPVGTPWETQWAFCGISLCFCDQHVAYNIKLAAIMTGESDNQQPGYNQVPNLVTVLFLERVKSPCHRHTVKWSRRKGGERFQDFCCP